MLVPIVVIYLVILTVYLGKVLVLRQWPSGWIGYLVSSVATVGILAWLLVRPLEAQVQHGWVRTYTRGFYLALLPSIAMLWLAIGKRVAQYGFTEPRYFLAVLSLWLAGVALYFTFGRSRNVKLIPATLCALAFITFAGPWGAYQVSLASQRRRLERLLVRHELLADGVARPAGGGGGVREVPFADRKEMSAVLRYLIKTHGPKSVATWFGGSLPRTVSVAVEPRVRAIMAHLGVAYVAPWERESRDESFNYRSGFHQDPIAIDGYSYAVHVTNQVLSDSVRIEAGTFLSFVKARAALLVARGGEPLLEIPLQPVVERAAGYRRLHDGRLPADVLRAEVRNQGAGALLYLTSLYGMWADTGLTVNSLDGELFLRLK